MKNRTAYLAAYPLPARKKSGTATDEKKVAGLRGVPTRAASDARYRRSGANPCNGSVRVSNVVRRFDRANAKRSNYYDSGNQLRVQDLSLSSF